MTSSAASYDSADRERGRFLPDLQELIPYRYLILQLVKRNVTSRYKRSVLGIAWTLLDPILTMSVMAVVYTALFRRSIEAFPLFILTGLVVWNFFAQSTSQAIKLFLHSRSLLGRVYMPRSAMGFAAVGTGLVNLLVSLIPLAALMIIFGRPFTPALLLLPVALLIATLFTVGIGLLVSSWSAFFADMENIYAFLLRLGMYLSGIFYTLDALPEQMRGFVAALPTYHLINLFRDPIYAGSPPGWDSFLYCAGWAVGAFVIGFWVFTRNANVYAYRI